MFWIVNTFFSLLMAWFSFPAVQQVAHTLYKAESLPPHSRILALTDTLTTLDANPSLLNLRTFVLRSRSEAYLQINDFDSAIEDLTQAIHQLDAQQAHPRTIAAVMVLRGQAILYLYEWDNVLAEYNAALALAPDYAPAYFYRGILSYSALTDRIPREDALADFETYLLLSPNGTFANQAQQYADLIRIELDALNAP
jgi:tetratricopeptide (TPR) repeat protein